MTRDEVYERLPSGATVPEIFERILMVRRFIESEERELGYIKNRLRDLEFDLVAKQEQLERQKAEIANEIEAHQAH